MHFAFCRSLVQRLLAVLNSTLGQPTVLYAIHIKVMPPVSYSVSEFRGEPRMTVYVEIWQVIKKIQPKKGPFLGRGQQFWRQHAVRMLGEELPSYRLKICLHEL